MTQKQEDRKEVAAAEVEDASGIPTSSSGSGSQSSSGDEEGTDDEGDDDDEDDEGDEDDEDDEDDDDDGDEEDDGDSPPQKLADAISVERVSVQAELTVDMAQMCAQLARLCEGAGQLGAPAWQQVRRISSHLVDVAQQVARAAGAVGNLVVEVPRQVVPLLDAVSSQCDGLGSLADAVVKDARALMEQLVHVTGQGEKVASQSRSLLEQTLEVMGTQQKMAAVDEVPSDVCATTAEVLLGLARVAGDVADDAVEAALTVGEAQLRVQHLSSSLEAALAAKRPSEGEDGGAGQEAERDGDSEDDGSTDGSSSSSEDAEDEAELSAPSRCAKRLRLLQALNNEVLNLQQELRTLVGANPSLLEPVTVSQREALFALVAEVLELSEAEASRAWRQASTCDERQGPSIPEAMEASLEFAFTAAAWSEVAAPSFEARLLRLAGLVDSAELCRLIGGGLFARCASLSHGQKGDDALARRCEVALAALRFSGAAAAAVA